MNKTYFEIEAGTVTYKRVENDIYYLLIYREKLDDFTMPKGHLEENESFEDAAIRETLEEGGIHVGVEKYLDAYEYRVKEKKKGVEVNIVRRVYCFLSNTISSVDDFRNPDEAEGLTSTLWLKYEDAYNKLSYESTKKIIALANNYLVDKSKNKFNLYATQIYSKIENLIKNDKKICTKLTHFGMIGSVNDTEGVKTWSDLDILMIFDSDNLGNIDVDILMRLKEIHNTISSMYSDIEISFLPHTLDDLKNYVVFAYLEQYKFANITFNSSGVNLKDYINKIIEKRSITPEIYERYTIHHIRHLRFNLIRAVASWNKNDKPIAKLVIDRLVETGIYLCGYHGIYIQGKKERLNKIIKLVDNKEIANIYREVVDLRTRWEDVTEKEAKNILIQGLNSLIKIENYLLSMHPGPVEEEYINKK